MTFPEMPQDGYLSSDPEPRFSEIFCLLTVILLVVVKFTVLLVRILQTKRTTDVYKYITCEKNYFKESANAIMEIERS